MHPLLRRLFEEHLPQGTALPPGWAEQLEELRGLRCEFAQGFLFSRPLDAADAERLLADDPRW
jgi:hypothetical protein